MEAVGTVPRSGFVTFAGVLAIVIGFVNVIGGIAAIAKDDTHRGEAHEVLFGIDYTTWGWFWLVLGVVQIIIGGLILARHASGLMLGVTWAPSALILTVFVIFVYPFWALVVIGINIFIIWGLLDHADEFELRPARNASTRCTSSAPRSSARSALIAFVRRGRVSRQ